MCTQRRVPRSALVISGSLVIAIEVSACAHIVVFRYVTPRIVTAVVCAHASLNFSRKPLKRLVNPSTRIETDALGLFRGDSLGEATAQAVSCDCDSVSWESSSDSCQCCFAALEPFGGGQLASGELDVSGKVPSSPRSSSSESDDCLSGARFDEDFGLIVAESGHVGRAFGYRRAYIVGFSGKALEFSVAELFDQGASSCCPLPIARSIISRCSKRLYLIGECKGIQGRHP